METTLTKSEIPKCQHWHQKAQHICQELPKYQWLHSYLCQASWLGGLMNFFSHTEQDKIVPFWSFKWTFGCQYLVNISVSKSLITTGSLEMLCYCYCLNVFVLKCVRLRHNFKRSEGGWRPTEQNELIFFVN